MERFANSTLATGCHTAGPIGHRRRGICPHSAVCSPSDVKSWWQVTSTTLYWCPSLSLFVYLCLPGIPYIVYYAKFLFEFIFTLADFQWLSYEGFWRTIHSHARLCIPEHYEHISESTRRFQFTPGCVTSLLLMPSISACLSPEYLEAPLWQHWTWDFTLVKNGKHLQNQKAGWVLGNKCPLRFFFNHFWSLVAMPRPNQKSNESLTAALQALRKQQELQRMYQVTGQWRSIGPVETHSVLNNFWNNPIGFVSKTVN